MNVGLLVYLIFGRFTWAFFELSVMAGMMAPHHNFVVMASTILKFGTGMKLDVFYTMVSKEFVMSLLLCSYDIMS